MFYLTGIHKKSANCQFSRDQQYSALTDYANQENHTINWSKATVIDREPDRLNRLIKEAIYIRKEGAQSMNLDEGSYQLSHACNHFLGTSSSSSRRSKNRKN